MSTIDELRKLGEIVSYNEDEVLFQQGEKGDYAFLILRGKVAVILNSIYDGSEIPIAEIGEGDIVGEMAVSDVTVRAATVKSISPVTALKIKESNFTEFIKMNPKYGKGLLCSLSRRIKSTRELIKERMDS